MLRIPLSSALSCVVAFGLLAAMSAPAPAQSDDAATIETAESAGDTDDPTARASKNEEDKGRTLLQTVADGGVVGLLIGLMSMAMVYLIVEHFLSINKAQLIPDGPLYELEQLIAKGQFDDALAYSGDPANDSLATACVHAGLVRYKSSEFGFAEYKTAMEEAGEDQTGKLYRKTEALGLIGSIAPMLGLIGTVLGMITAFNDIPQDGAAKPGDVAPGIAQALVTTLLGLIVAIPAMVAFSYFRNKIDSLVAEAGKRVEQVTIPLSRQKR